MVDESLVEFKDYKVYVFNGIPKLIQVDFNRFSDHKRRFYDVNWNKMNFSYKYPDDEDIEIKKLVHLNEMLQMSKKISKNISFVRCDFYIAFDRIYFGEITFYPQAGLGKFNPEIWDLIDISNVK